MVWEYIGMCAGVLVLLSHPLLFLAMYKKLDAAEGYMQCSSFIVGCRHTFRNAHFEGRPQRVLAMATVILIPTVIEWRGMVLVEDVEKIPRPLKYWMVIPSLIALTSFITMVISGYFAYY